MEKMSNDTLYLFTVCLIIFLFSYQANIMFYTLFGLPFGMSDVDCYACWIGGKSLREDCISSVPLTHLFFVEIIKSVGGFSSLVWFMPLLLSILIPLALYYFYDSMNFGKYSLWCVLLFLFGTFYYIMFTFTAIYCEILAFFFFIIAMTFYQKRNWSLFLLFVGLSVISHYMTLLLFFLLMLAELIKSKKYFIVSLSLLSILSILISLIILYSWNLMDYTTLFSNYNQDGQPSLFQILFLSTCPIFLFLLMFTRLGTKYNIFFILLLIITPFTQFARGVPFMHIFLVPYILSGYLSVKRLSNLKFIDIIFAFMILLWFSYCFDFMAHSMILESTFRGINLTEFMR